MKLLNEGNFCYLSGFNFGLARYADHCWVLIGLNDKNDLIEKVITHNETLVQNQRYLIKKAYSI